MALSHPTTTLPHPCCLSSHHPHRHSSFKAYPLRPLRAPPSSNPWWSNAPATPPMPVGPHQSPCPSTRARYCHVGHSTSGGENGNNGLGQMRDWAQQQKAMDNGTRHQWDEMMAEVVGNVWVRRLLAGGGQWWRLRAMKAACEQRIISHPFFCAGTPAPQSMCQHNLFCAVAHFFVPGTEKCPGTLFRVSIIMCLNRLGGMGLYTPTFLHKLPASVETFAINGPSKSLIAG